MQWPGEQQRNTVSNLSDEQRETLIMTVRALSDDEVITLLSFLPSQAISELMSFAFPWQQTFTFRCKLKGNEHDVTDVAKLVCDQDPSHEFCTRHFFTKNRCPEDGSTLTLRK